MNINKYIYVFAILLSFGLVHSAQKTTDNETQFGELSLDAINIISDFEGKSDSELAQIRSLTKSGKVYVSQYILQKSNSSGVAIDFSKHGKWLTSRDLRQVHFALFNARKTKEGLEENPFPKEVLTGKRALEIIFLNFAVSDKDSNTYRFNGFSVYTTPTKEQYYPREPASVTPSTILVRKKDNNTYALGDKKVSIEDILKANMNSGSLRRAVDFKDVKNSKVPKDTWVKVDAADPKSTKVKNLILANPKVGIWLDLSKNTEFVDKKGVLTLNNDELPAKLQNLLITNSANDIKATATKFLYRNNVLTFVELNLPKLKTVGYEFLFNNDKLTSVELDFPKLETMGSHFLYENKVLTSVKLDFPNLETVGDKFLSATSSLKSITLIGETYDNERLIQMLPAQITIKHEKREKD